MNLVLIGYRGTGKSAVGKVLADMLSRPFCDADVFLEKKLGTTIKNMVAREGWPFFRAREKEVIQELSAKQNCVIATGGGAVMDKDNVARLAKDGFFVLLKADVPTMIKRIQRDVTSQQQRPDLLDGDIYEETAAMVTKRMPTYEKVADLCVDTTDMTIGQVAEKIIKEGPRNM